MTASKTFAQKLNEHTQFVKHMTMLARDLHSHAGAAVNSEKFEEADRLFAKSKKYAEIANEVDRKFVIEHGKGLQSLDLTAAPNMEISGSSEWWEEEDRRRAVLVPLKLQIAAEHSKKARKTNTRIENVSMWIRDHLIPTFEHSVFIFLGYILALFVLVGYEIYTGRFVYEAQRTNIGLFYGGLIMAGVWWLLYAFVTRVHYYPSEQPRFSPDFRPENLMPGGKHQHLYVEKYDGGQHKN